MHRLITRPGRKVNNDASLHISIQHVKNPLWFLFCFFSSLTEATVELSLDSPRDQRKKDATAKPSASAPSLLATASLTKPQPSALEEVHISNPRLK